MDLRPDDVRTRADLVEYIAALQRDLVTHPDPWENPTLERYLDALSRWTADMDGAFKNRGLATPDEPTWRLIAQKLLAASMYE